MLLIARDGYAGASLWDHVSASLTRIVSAAVIATTIGVPLGLLMGLNRWAKGVFDVPIEFYWPLPPLAYLLRVVVPNIAAYDAFYKRLIARIEIRNVSSSFAMEQIKYTTELPLDYLVLDKTSSFAAA